MTSTRPTTQELIDQAITLVDWAESHAEVEHQPIVSAINGVAVGLQAVAQAILETKEK